MSLNGPRLRRRLTSLVPHLFLLPAVALAVVPFWWVLVTSMRSGQAVFRDVYPLRWQAFVPYEVSLRAYLTVLFDAGFGQALINSLEFALVAVVLGLVINTPVAFALAKFQFRGRGIVFALVVVSIFVPVEAIVLPLLQVVNGLGLSNTFAGVVAPLLANGFVIFLLRQFFSGIPHELYEAAVIDGASPGRIFVSIYIPLVRSALVSAALILFLVQWNSYFWPLVVIRDGNLYPVQVALSALQGNIYGATRWPEILAAATMAGAIPVALLLPFQRFLRGAFEGSVHG